MAQPSSPTDVPTGQPFVFNVSMSCKGCSGAVEKALTKLEGITFNVDLEKQEATVTPVQGSEITFEEVNAKIAKTGKTIKDRHIGEQRVNENGEPIDASDKLIAA